MSAVAFLSPGCGGEPDERAGGVEASAIAPGRQVALDFEEPSGDTLRYLLYLPRGYRNGGRRWPVLLYLHGADVVGTGRRGLRRLRRQGIPKAIDRRARFPFIAVSPLTSSSWVPARLTPLLDAIERRYAVDPSRVYASGFSLGAYGVTELAGTHPRRFAAIAPIAGGQAGRRAACRLRTVALWAFHGSADEVVPPSESRAMVRRARRCRGKARLTLYPRAGHFVAERTYANPGLYRWLAGHSRRPQPRHTPPVP